MPDLTSLAAFPSFVRSSAEGFSDEELRTRDGDRFSLVEHAWHLADLEVEGYGERIERLLRDDDPELPDFKGDAIAAARRYHELELAPALERFANARAANIARLSALDDAAWSRSGRQEGVGVVTLTRVAEMMAIHDGEHEADIRALLASLRG